MLGILQTIMWIAIGIVALFVVLFIVACVVGHSKKEADIKDGKWRARKRLLFFGLPWTFTVYECDNEKLLVKTGLFSQNEEDIKLYRILDLGLKRSLLQRMLGLGSITVSSSDRSAGNNYIIENIRASKQAKEWISDVVEKKRDEKRVSAREYMHSDTDDIDDADLV